MKNYNNISLGRKKISLYLSRDFKRDSCNDTYSSDYALWIGDKPELDPEGYYVHREGSDNCTFLGSWFSSDFPYKNIKIGYGKCIEVRLSSLSRVKDKINRSNKNG